MQSPERGSTNFYKELINRGSSKIWWTGHQPGVFKLGRCSYSNIYKYRHTILNLILRWSDGTIITANVVTAFDKFADADSVDISLVMTGLEIKQLLLM